MLGNLFQLNNSQLHPSPPPKSAGVVCVNQKTENSGEAWGI